MQNKIKLILFSACLAILLFNSLAVLAADEVKCPEGTPDGTICLGDPMGYRSYNDSASDDTAARLTGFAAQVAYFMIFPIGALAFLAFVLGGFYWIFSGGNEERVKKGREIMVWSIIGIIVVFSSYAILTLVFKTITGSG